MPVLSQHMRGILITALGVLIISPDGLLTRLIYTDHWTLIFWRALFLSFGMCLLANMAHPKDTWRRYKTVGKAGLIMAMLYSLGTVSFITAIKHTSVANTLIILSTTPLSAALIGLVFFRETIILRTWCAIGLVAIGVFVISSDSDGQGATLYGDVAAMLGAFFLAAGFTVVRHRPTVSIFPALSISGLLTSIAVFPLAQPLSITQQDMGFLLIMGVYMLPLATALMFIGPRYVPASEVGLMLLLESVLGPTWVWLALNEVPGSATLVGGAIILTTLAMNTLWAMQSASSSRTTAGIKT